MRVLCCHWCRVAGTAVVCDRTGSLPLDCRWTGMTMFAEKSRCRLCEVMSVSGSPQAGDHQISTTSHPSGPAPLNMFLPQLRDMVLAAWFLRGGTSPEPAV